TSGEVLRGYGELPFRGRRSGGGVTATWSFLNDVLGELATFAIDISSAEAARGSLVELSKVLAQLADAGVEDDFEESVASASGRPRFTGARFALEMAFADFAAKGVEVGLGRLLSGESHRVAIVRPIMTRGATGNFRRGEVEQALQKLPASAELAIDFERSLRDRKSTRLNSSHVS